MYLSWPAIQTTDLGRIASHYYVSYTTIAHFNEHLKPTMTDIELLRLFSLAEEFRCGMEAGVGFDSGWVLMVGWSV